MGDRLQGVLGQVQQSVQQAQQGGGGALDAARQLFAQRAQQPTQQQPQQPQPQGGGLLAQFQNNMPTPQLDQSTQYGQPQLRQIDPKQLKQQGQPGWLSAILKKLQPMIGQMGRGMLQRGGLGGLGGMR